MKVVERKETDLVPHFKIEWSDKERVNLRAWEHGPYEIRVGDEWVRFVPGLRLICRARSLDFYLQEVVEFQLYCAWLTLSPGPNVGDELELSTMVVSDFSSPNNDWKKP